MKFRISPLFVLCASLLIVSCNKQDTFIENTESVAEVQEKIDFLTFSSEAELEELSNRLVDMDQPEQFMRENYPGFKSYHDYFYGIDFAKMEETGVIQSQEDYVRKFAVSLEEEESGDKVVVPLVEPYKFQLLTNADGVVQVGENIVQFKDDWKYTARAKNVTDFSDITQAFKVKKELINVQLEKRGQTVHLCTKYYAHPVGTSNWHRLKPRWKRYQGSHVLELYVQIQHEKRGIFRTWFPNVEDELSFSGNFNIATSGRGDMTNLNYSYTGYNRAGFTKRIYIGSYSAQEAGFPRMGFLPGSTADHESKDGGVAAGASACTITVN